MTFISTPGWGLVGYTPVWQQNFNSFSNGTSLGGGVVFLDGSRTIADTGTKYGGSGASAKMSIRVGDASGNGEWGGIKSITALYQGDEIWVRWRQYWPTAFAFTASPAMKFLRLRRRNSLNVTQGYVDLYIDNAASSTPYYTVAENQQVETYFGSSAIPRDQWITYEVYIKLDTVSVDSGGQGRMRVWLDGTLAQERTDIITLGNAAHKLDAVYWFTYWNNETPPDNDTWCDDIVIATSASPPTTTDSGGRPYIGM